MGSFQDSCQDISLAAGGIRARLQCLFVLCFSLAETVIASVVNVFQPKTCLKGVLDNSLDIALSKYHTATSIHSAFTAVLNGFAFALITFLPDVISLKKQTDTCA